ncbi:MAG TPA: methyltransferase [Caulobacterales bacterium]|nr:methyltransferase [Caulobacterales bacterium]
MTAPTLDRRRLAALIAGAGLSACGRSSDADAPQPGSLAWAAGGPWRIEPERDPWRHPIATLQFWGLRPDMTVLEILPGRGWYTAIIAPYLAHGGGRLIAASFDPATASPAQRATLAEFDARFLHNRRFGEIVETVVNAEAPLAPPSSVDLAILANNIHTLMAGGVAEHVFSALFDALKPGGVLGVEQHRAPSSGLQDPLAGTGYVQEPYVRLLAQEAGLEFVAASDINANPRDNHNHPFGVWTLPPTLRTSPLGQPDNPHFDARPYQAIGESDRMTLKFRKPANGQPAPPPRQQNMGPP